MSNNLTRLEAAQRAELLANLHYDVHLDLTTGNQTFASETVVNFRCPRPGVSTFIEFIGPALQRAELNGKVLPRDAFDGERLQLDGLVADNTLTITATADYMRDGTGLHRFEDPVDGRVYMHSQFATNDTHRAYACFDQPDLKATYDFNVKAPADWVVVSNTPGARTDGGIWTFPTTKVMSTYVTAIVAGQYHSVHQDHRGIPLGLFCRQSLAQYLDPEEIFEITRQGLDYFDERFGYPYAFGKYDQLFVPEFSAGAMENAGCVTHNEFMVFRSRVTESSRMRRAEIILHEMAHMWFGDLVTMRWWDDLWLNESFATYMAFLAAVEATRFKGGWLDFTTGEKTKAQAQDQLPTTHPIVADIPDVESVHLNFDPITYEKGASVLKQLVAWVGDDSFFKGVEAYFRRHEYGNSELKDFLKALEEASGRDLKAWSRLWLEQAGVNTIRADLEVEGDRIKRATLVQEAPADHPTLRPHRLRVGVFDLEGSDLKRRASIELDVDGARTPVPEVAGKRAADLVLVNDADLTYAKIRFDPRSLDTLKRHVRDLGDPLARAVAKGALWDMTRDAQLPAREYTDIVLNHVDAETYVPVLEQLLGRVATCVDVYGDPANREALRARLLGVARRRLQAAAAGSDFQLVWARTFIGAARKPADLEVVRDLLAGANPFPGLTVDFDVRWWIVYSLASVGAAGPQLIEAELKRDPTDNGLRQAATADAARPAAEAKAVAWKAIVDDGSLSLATKRAMIRGFKRYEQEDLLHPYVKAYFENLMPVWRSGNIDEALAFVRGMYPSAVVTQEVIDLTDRQLETDLPGPVRRSLLELQDDVKRALRARTADGS